MKIELLDLIIRALVTGCYGDGEGEAAGYGGIRCTPSNLTR